jgi:hypothetical protein
MSWIIRANEQPVSYWAGPHRWKHNRGDAIQFARKDDAERIISFMSDELQGVVEAVST